jgi:hypothetical protein
MMTKWGHVFACMIIGALVGCSAADRDPHEGATPLSPGPKLGKEDGMGVPGLHGSVGGGTTRVWSVFNQWQDTNTTAAKLAGMAWEANSGLNWDEKFAAWVGSFEKIDAYKSTYSQTFELTTRWGKKLPAPKLDCADVWIFLRATFAAWYNLPFYIEGYDGKTRVFFGHFGVRTKSGNWGSMPHYTSWYKDHTKLASTYTKEQLLKNWPQDKKLRARGTIPDDDQPFLFDGARMGAYLDEIHLNKRAGHFIRMLLIYTGTPNLADSRNTFNLVPDGLRVGDAMLYRRARNGSGHTMVAVRVGENSAGKTTVNVVSGNVPPRQPKWESEAASKSRFTDDEGGGPSANSKGEIYSHLGGGLKRWRVAKLKNGVWVNTFMTGDEASWIDDTDYERIGKRPKQFEDLLGEVPPEEKRDALLKVIEDARMHLQSYPASCAARERREKAFKELYKLFNSYHFSYKSKEEVDKLYRVKADYVFAMLVYEKSRTCCWNSSTSHMYQIVMDYAMQLEAQSSTCAPPPIFMVQSGGFHAFKKFAKDTGRELQWKPWSADETCPQKNVTDDTEAVQLWTDYCDVFPKNNSTGADAGADSFSPDAGPYTDAGATPPDPDVGAAIPPGSDVGVPFP